MEIPLDILEIVVSFLVVPQMKLLDWIPNKCSHLFKCDITTLQSIRISYFENMNAKKRYNNNNTKTDTECIRMLRSLIKTEIDGECLYGGLKAINFLEQNSGLINWNLLSFNPNAIHLLEIVIQHDINKVNWTGLSRNPQLVACNTFVRKSHTT